MTMTDFPEVHVTTRAQLRDWFIANHATAPGIWLVSWRSNTGRERISVGETVEECLCFGWIDSRIRKLDDERNALRLTPRRTGGTWSALNKERVERLRQQGRMTTAGEAVIQRSIEDRSWAFLDDIEALITPDDLRLALDTAGTTEGWDRVPASKKKASLWWIKTAKRPATREKRIGAVSQAAARGESIAD